MIIETAGMRIPVLELMPFDQKFNITVYSFTALLRACLPLSKFIDIHSLANFTQQHDR